jgi:hypothetical protein
MNEIKNFTDTLVSLAVLLFFCLSRTNASPGSLYEPAPGPYSIIAVSGKAKAVIVTPSRSSWLEEFAANELQKYLEKISQAKIPVKKETASSENTYSIFIGMTKMSEEAGVMPDEEGTGRDGFEIRSLKKGMVIRGRTDLGTLFGVYELLERYFGVRWFMPGEEYIPVVRTLKTGRINLTYKPSFANRWVGNGEWPLHQRMNAYVTAAGKPVGINWKWHFHTFATLMSPDKYYSVHPEYFAMVNGDRKVTESRTHGNQLCTSNPEVIKEIARNLIDTLDKEPGIEIVTLSPNDGGGFCECDNCRALDEPGRDWFAKYSNRLAVFNKAVSGIVKMKHPGVMIKVGAYAMYARPPLDPEYKPEDNQIIQLCHLYFCHNHPLGSNMCKAGETYEPKDEYLPNQEFEKILDQWLKLSKHVYIYEYYSVGGMARANLPWPMIHTMRTDIPYYRSKGVEGFYTQQSDDLFFRLGLNFYVAAKLCWNADLNVDALLNDYFEKFYGPSASPMKDFYMAGEKSMQDWNGCSSYGLQGVNPRMGIKIFTPELLVKMQNSVVEAERLSKGNKIFARRVAMARRIYDETDKSVNDLMSVAR